MAQRALDRRLTEELVRFKNKITTLTKELDIVRAHDQEATKQAKEGQDKVGPKNGGFRLMTSLFAVERGFD